MRADKTVLVVDDEVAIRRLIELKLKIAGYQVISACEEFNLDSTTIALSGGEDYELLFTVKQSDFTKVKANPHLTIIGHMTPEKEGVHLITRANTKIPLIARGWNPMEND